MTKDTVHIHGKEYETVASRVNRFRDEYKLEYAVVTELIDRDDQTVVMKATIQTLDGNVVATGYAEESRTSSSINRTSALENCETSAIGRALAAFGLAGTEYASANEVGSAVAKQERGETVAPKPKMYGEASPKQKELIAKKLTEKGVAVEEMKAYLIEQYGITGELSKEDASLVIEDLITA